MRNDAIDNLLMESMNDLELPAVLEEVAVHALSAPGSEKVLVSQPESDPEAVRRGLDLVSQLMEVISIDGVLGLADLAPMEGMLSRIDSPAVILESEEILAVRDMLAACSTVRERLEGLEDRLELLRRQADRLMPLRPLRARITQIFDEHGVVRSSASPALAALESA